MRVSGHCTSMIPEPAHAPIPRCLCTILYHRIKSAAKQTWNTLASAIQRCRVNPITPALDACLTNPFSLCQPSTLPGRQQPVDRCSPAKRVGDQDGPRQRCQHRASARAGCGWLVHCRSFRPIDDMLTNNAHTIALSILCQDKNLLQRLSLLQLCWWTHGLSLTCTTCSGTALC
jgi:hypothetical protein